MKKGDFMVLVCVSCVMLTISIISISQMHLPTTGCSPVEAQSHRQAQREICIGKERECIFFLVCAFTVLPTHLQFAKFESVGWYMQFALWYFLLPTTYNTNIYAHYTWKASSLTVVKA